MLILVADDDPTSLLIVETTLRNLGHLCLSATDGTQAWEIFQTRRPDVVISDWLMPGLTGLELCRMIRAHPARYTYLILVTGQDSRDQMFEGMSAGADDYLVKPLDADDARASADRRGQSHLSAPPTGAPADQTGLGCPEGSGRGTGPKRLLRRCVGTHPPVVTRPQISEFSAAFGEMTMECGDAEAYASRNREA